MAQEHLQWLGVGGGGVDTSISFLKNRFLTNYLLFGNAKVFFVVVTINWL